MNYVILGMILCGVLVGIYEGIQNGNLTKARVKKAFKRNKK